MVIQSFLGFFERLWHIGIVYERPSDSPIFVSNLTLLHLQEEVANQSQSFHPKFESKWTNNNNNIWWIICYTISKKLNRSLNSFGQTSFGRKVNILQNWWRQTEVGGASAHWHIYLPQNWHFPLWQLENCQQLLILKYWRNVSRLTEMLTIVCIWPDTTARIHAPQKVPVRIILVWWQFSRKKRHYFLGCFSFWSVIWFFKILLV